MQQQAKQEVLILVDEHDRQTGTEEKMKAHREGKLHRAFSVFIFNTKGEMLITCRAKTKYHCGGMWTNACCSHPRPGETAEQAAHRRLQEELGFDCKLKEIFSFIYKVEFDNGLWEHEFDHIFVGVYDQDPVPDASETDAFAWMSMDGLKAEINDSEKYTRWFQIAFQKMMDEGLLDRIFGEGVGLVIRQIASGEHPVSKEPHWSPSTAVRARYFSRSSWNSIDVPL
ncbi:MAG: isopentenyl-diphosphate Delta-isomerase [Thaumarchaeota archaeon]|nr:isopentenyl-diphosphate Delta-isomerase [Nitrososphaerota archaeon]